MGLLLNQYFKLKRKRTFSFQRRTDLSPETKKSIDRIVKDFLLFCENTGLKSSHDITSKNYAAFIRMLHSKRRLSKKTIERKERKYKYALKMFFKDLNLSIRVKIK